MHSLGRAANFVYGPKDSPGPHRANCVVYAGAKLEHGQLLGISRQIIGSATRRRSGTTLNGRSREDVRAALRRQRSLSLGDRGDRSWPTAEAQSRLWGRLLRVATCQTILAARPAC
jgi:hypothetical protein